MHKRTMGRQLCRDLADLSPMIFLYQAEQCDLYQTMVSWSDTAGAYRHSLQSTGGGKVVE